MYATITYVFRVKFYFWGIRDSNYIHKFLSDFTRSSTKGRIIIIFHCIKIASGFIQIPIPIKTKTDNHIDAVARKT